MPPLREGARLRAEDREFDRDARGADQRDGQERPPGAFEPVEDGVVGGEEEAQQDVGGVYEDVLAADVGQERQGGQGEGGDDDQPRAAQRARQPVAVLEPGHHRQERERDDEQEQDEPQVRRCDAAGVLGPVGEVGEVLQEEVRVAAFVAEVEPHRVVRLGRDDDQAAEQERHQQPGDALACVFAGRPLPEGVAARHAGEQEQQRHEPVRRGDDDVGDGVGFALDVEVVAAVEDTGGVVGDQEQDREVAEPVDVVLAHGPAPFGSMGVGEAAILMGRLGCGGSLRRRGRCGRRRGGRAGVSRRRAARSRRSRW